MLKERKRNRLNSFDYSTPGFYFITICVHSELFGRNIFGTIKNGKMLLNKYGSIVDNVWQNLPCHYNNCALDKFIIMPNHFHGIVIIVGDNNIVGNGFKPFRTGIQNEIISDTGIQNEIISGIGVPDTKGKKHGLPEIIRGFKTFSSRGINEIHNGVKFHWQKSYYDHIIRNNDSLLRIRKYIINNPVNCKRKTTE